MIALDGKPPSWKANSRPQERFLSCGAYESLYGGSAGGGKSEALLVGALRWVEEPTYRAILFRRTFPELEKSLIDRSRRIFRGRGEYNESKHVWEFASGARIFFGYLEREGDVEQYQSAEFSYVAFDELTHFTESQFTYMQSRGRGSNHIRFRAGSNPGGDGHDWVQRRWGPWLGGPEWEGVRAEPGEVLWYVNAVGCTCFEVGPDDQVERYVPRDHVPRCKHDLAFSRTFIPARAEDNPANDAGYIARLGALDPVRRSQLRDGNWLIRPAAGLYFKRGWFKFCDAVPSGFRKVRRWDLAATEENDPSTGKPKNDPDWTVGVKMAGSPDPETEPRDARTFVEDAVRLRASPAEVERTILATANMDGVEVAIHIPQDPGQAGKDQVRHYAALLRGFDVRFEPETGNKVTRAGPWSAQVEAGNAWLVRGPWNEPFIRVHEAFPTKGAHDDDVDAAAGGFAELSKPQPGMGWS